ncbi:TIM-barrel domain-containing protein [Bacteroides sp. 224]|uniref:glycoside hydrolase family 31 protein n=1 Tax=Bacteroides sp. 224 TaxID=2302936 RepID=UPI0013D490A8|nr:TIM-barrel domain-containing protein [Bacteroides sp. 224]NDV66963.1 DUF5110 domain-containing protein [Bacteroides sp. 224]
MKRFNYWLFIIAVLSWFGCSSSIQEDSRGCSFVCDSILYRIEFMSEGCVRILSYPKGDTLVTQRLVVDASKPTFKDYTSEETGQTFVFRTHELSVTFNKKEAAFTFQEVSTGKVLLKEKGNQKARNFKRSEAGGEPCLEVTQWFIPTPDEAIYGLGQYQNGIMNYRGKSALLLQANMDIVNPFLISTHGYGILWDNYSSTKFEDTEEGYSFTSEVGDASDYYFIYGKNMDEVVAGYRNLTGDVPMFGKWVYGFWQSKERYKSFDELKAVVKEYRKREIPLDNIVQDWEYWGDKPLWNSLAFHPTNFSNPRQVIDELHQQYNVHFMLSVWPGFGPKTAVYQSLDSIGALFDEPTWAGYKVFDAYNPTARNIFWQYLKKGLYDMGVDAWWMDATEPSFREGFTQLKQEEKTKSAGKTYLGSFHRYLNTYSLEMMKDFYQRLRTESNQKRAFILTRSAFASQQRYGTAVWSGDVSASWENMHKQLAAGLNLSMSGIPYWTSDTGGFFVTERDAKYPDGLKSKEYKELYARWFQFGAFTPIFRAHGTNVPREVWQFGEKGTPFYDNQVKYIRLRYRLLPYIYSMSYQVTAHNYTMLRGLAMDFTADPETFTIDNAYMFGSSLLVRPVFFPQSEEKNISTYLPKHEGNYWYDFWTGQAYNGGGKQVQTNILDVLPLYVKAGSILPLANVKQYAMEYPDQELELRIYSGTDASFLWYEDEGDSYRYEEGVCSKVAMQWQEAERTLTIGQRDGNYPGMPKQVKMTVKLYLPEGTVPVQKECIYTGEEIKIKF